MVVLTRTVIDSPVGPLRAIASPRGLCGLEFDVARRTERLRARLDRWFAPYDLARDEPDGDRPCHPWLRAAGDWLAEFFAGRPPTARVELDLRGTTFELRVWRALREVPFGATSTYGRIAACVGTPRGSRAVGLANGSNPVALIVPCHRIVGTNGTLTGYGGGLDRKRWLLDHESRASTTRLF